MKIQLDKEYEVKLNLGAMCDFEEETGNKITELDLDSMGMTEVRNLVYCMIQDEEKPTKSQLGKMISMDKLKEIMSVITKEMANTESKEEKKLVPQEKH